VSYKVEITSVPTKFLERLRDESLKRRIVRALRSLETNPRPPGCLKMQGSELYRIRVGDYRVIYQVRDATLVVLVVNIGNRRDVYR
jgi:mRNA interferase RelE/StbE